MTDVYQLVCEALAPLGYPVREQGALAAGGTLPETFVTYFVVSRVPLSHADNLPASYVLRVQITLFSKRPAIKQSAARTLGNAMRAAGFLEAGGRDLAYNVETGHYAYSADFRLYDAP